jgi:glycosyltransferase involved in cell wall biosynthesis
VAHVAGEAESESDVNGDSASRSLRVAMLVQDYLPALGGAERQLSNLAPLLVEHGVDVHVLTRHRAGSRRFEASAAVPVYRLPAPGPRVVASASYTASALWRLRQLNPAVLHAHGLLSPSTTALAARELWGVPVLAKPLRGGALGDIVRLRRKLGGRLRLAALARQVDAFAVISREIDTELAELDVPPERRLYLPNGVDTQRFRPIEPAARAARRMELSLPSGPLVVFSGRLAPEKNLAELLKIWPRIRAAIADAGLLILGSGPERANLERLVSAGVMLQGKVDDVSAYLACCDVFVLPSLGEGLSNALLEAMAAGLPVVATDVGGSGDVIRHGESGWLVPPRAPTELLAGLLALLRNPTLAAELGQRARAHATQHHDLGILAARLVEVYRKLARRPGAGRRVFADDAP